MTVQHKAKYDTIIERVVSKKTSIPEIISYLHKNRLKFNDSTSNSKNNDADSLKTNDFDGKNDEQLLDKYVNSNFVSYFLKYLHDESNSYLMMRLQSQINFDEKKINEQGKIVNKMNNLEDNYNNSFHISPKTYGPFISPGSTSNNILRQSPNEKLNLIVNNNGNRNNNPNFSGGGNNGGKRSGLPNQIHKWNSGSEIRSTPTEFSTIIYNNKNKRKTLVLQPKNAWENSSTPKILTPTYSNKVTTQSKPSLFDFVTSPPLQNMIKNTDQKQDQINDFKARFYQHKNKLENIDQNIEQNMNKKSQGLQKVDKVEEAPIKKNLPPVKQISDYKTAILEKLNDPEISKITILAELYANLLLNNFILTINTELFFLFQLLTLSIIEEKAADNVKTTSSNLDIFGSMEACIYFSMVTLKSLECILKYLKSSTLLELKENVYIKAFPNLFDENSAIRKCEINKEEIKSKERFVLFESKQAPFYAENSFHEKNMSIACKNQRDAFYDIFWHWEKHHKSENWNFAECLGDKVRLLVTLRENMTHFMQFIKLFQEQLVLICKDDKMLLDNKNDQIDGPEHIRSIYDPLKLKRLNARMSTPKPNYGPNPSPTFFGYQEFFKEFIDISSSPVFHQYLKDSIANEIDIIHRDIPDLSGKDDSSLNKDLIQDMLLRLRILGKFLGYLYFCPYSHPTPNHLVRNLVEIRNNRLMPLDLQQYVERAVDKKHLVLTIPFVVEFLSMMDEHAYLIDSIQQTLSTLIVIYNSTSMLIKSASFSVDKFLLLIYIAWLLQLKKIQYSQLKIKQKFLAVDNNKAGVDDLQIITPLLLDFCCPFLDELQRLMIKFTTGVKRYEQKIKDVSHLFAFELVNEYSAKGNLDPNHKFDKNQVQMQLISQFLFLHPSYKRLVEFAAETTLANYIKYFRQHIFKRRLNEEIKLEALQQVGKEYDSIEVENILSGIAKRISQKFGAICVENSLEFFKEKIENVIINSMDKNSTPLVNTTNQIALYKTVQKLSQWIKTNLNEEIFKVEIKLKMCKKIINSDKLLYGFIYNEKDGINDESTQKMMQSNYLMLFEKFNLFKSLLKDLIQGTRTSLNGTTEDMVLGTLEQIKSYLIENKNDNKLLKPFDIQLCNLTWEVILFYKVNKEYTSRFLNDFIELFVDIEFCVNDGKSEILIMERLFCPRNTYFLKSIQNKECMIDELKSLLEQTFIHRKKTISNTQNTSKNNVTTTEAMLQLSMS